MAFTYDPTTNRGLVRLIITDTDGGNIIFQDAEIDAFLTLQDDNVKRAAAQALDVIASSEALVLKQIKLLNLTTNGPAVAAALRAHAAQLRQQADAEEVDGAFDIAEMTVNDFAARERVWNQALRGQI